MRMIYWNAEKNYEKALLPLLVEGAAAAGIDLAIKPNAEYREPEGDASLIFGVTKREILWDHRERNFPLLYLDKGYCRTRTALGDQSVPAWWRMCWQDVHPTAYLMEVNRPGDRWEKMGMRLGVRAKASPDEGHLVILGSSEKFHLTMKLDHPTAWAEKIRDHVHRYCRNPIIYRPKPSWKYARPIEGCAFDWGTKTDVRTALCGAWCAITYGSIACVDAICYGVPIIALGNAVSSPISSSFLSDVTDPLWKAMAIREQWAANLAYCNFTPAEIGDGTAWKILKEQMTHAL
jgi:hypothetical protein